MPSAVLSHPAPREGLGRGPSPAGRDPKPDLLSHPAESPDEATVADQESEDDLSASRTSLERQAPPRGNTTVHVCWHRNTSVSVVDFSVAVEVRAASCCSPGPEAGIGPSRSWPLALREVGEGDAAGLGRTMEPCWLRLPMTEALGYLLHT